MLKGRTKKYLILGLGIAAVIFAVAMFQESIRSNFSSVKIQPDSDLVPAASEKTVTVKDAESLFSAWAQELLAEMSLEEKVGQIFLAGFPSDGAAEKARVYHLGGFLLFAKDVRNKLSGQLKEEIESYQRNAKINLFIAVDEEGGIVNRISVNPQYGVFPHPSPQKLYQEGGFERIAQDTIEKARLLLSLGVNLNMAPVCDVSVNPDDYIYKRSFGRDAEMTAVYVQTVVSIMKEKQIGSVLKHFPGYGSNLDTHAGSVMDQRSYESFAASDFVPFQAGIQSGADSVLVSHNTVVCMDDSLPASLSIKVHDILRKELDFQGVILTDDLSMTAITSQFDRKEAAVMAVEAGNDLLCTHDFEVQIPAVIQAVKSGRISEARIDQSVIRLLEWKLKLGILPQKEDFYTVAAFLDREVYLSKSYCDSLH